MPRLMLKIVPDDQPNADGRWIEAEIPSGFNPHHLIPVPNHHVVQATPASDPQDGGPMHAQFLYRVPAPHQFDASWLSADHWRLNLQAHTAAQRMLRDAIGELFGPTASLASEEGVLHKGPEPHHEAEAQIEALQRVKAVLDEQNQLLDAGANVMHELVDSFAALASDMVNRLDPTSADAIAVKAGLARLRALAPKPEN